MTKRKLEAWVSVDPEGRARPILCATKEAALYQNSLTRSGDGVLVRMVPDNPRADAVVRAAVKMMKHPINQAKLDRLEKAIYRLQKEKKR